MVISFILKKRKNLADNHKVKFNAAKRIPGLKDYVKKKVKGSLVK